MLGSIPFCFLSLVYLKTVPQVTFGYRRSQPDHFLRHRVNELYRPGMQTDTAIRVGTWRAIFQITFNGTSHLGQLATNLMMPSGFQIHLQ